MKLIGDIHGEWQKYANMLKRRIRSTSVQLGDHGWGFKNDWKYDAAWLFERNAWFLRGNHDSDELCRQQPNYLGDVGYRAPVFFVSGGFSIDYMLRKPGVDWWEQEQLTEIQRKKMVDLYKLIQPEIVISHDAPTKAAEHLLRPLAVGRSNYTSYSENDYYKDKLEGVSQSTLGKALQEMLEAHAPKLWYFAHFHTAKTFGIEGSYGTTFRVLTINEVVDVPFEFETEDTITIDPEGVVHGLDLAHYGYPLVPQGNDHERLSSGGPSAEVNPPLADPGQA